MHISLSGVVAFWLCIIKFAMVMQDFPGTMEENFHTAAVSVKGKLFETSVLLDLKGGRLEKTE